MGGKGSRRREKNYKAAHGGYSRLPPPPVLSQVDAVPSKLRELRKLISSLSAKPQDSAAKDHDANKKRNPKDGSNSGISGMNDGGNDKNLKTSEHTDGGDDSEKKKKKRKRKQVNDLRFETTMENSNARLKKGERKKKYLEDKKKKHKKARTEEDLDFPGREEIKFGEVVEAPPKLTVPKAFKKAHDASQERIRLRAIETYRNRKGWASRPGIQLPLPVTKAPAY